MPVAKKAKKLIIVRLSLQVLEAYEEDKVICLFKCVTGDENNPTNPGTFHVFSKQRIYRSKKYDAQMNYALFFTADGKAIHQYHGPVPLDMLRLTKQRITNWVGSHGCVRLTEENARRLFDWTPSGTKVIIQ
jgi:lipoprotein-anchoring transpeptidase ErfK/SrfK